MRGACRAKRLPRPGHEQYPGEQAADTDDRERGESLLEQHDADHHGQQGRAAPRERVDQRERTAAVRGCQQHEVGRLENTRHDGEPDGRRRDRRGADGEVRNDPDRQQDGGPDGLETHGRRERVARRLEEDVQPACRTAATRTSAMASVGTPEA